ncbi:hypothetical protein OH77DRAFT_492649 [Trametes cingulata]|nr:hypothetical protein OH77DRAFT_492649 [Trametes cingulata]
MYCIRSPLRHWLIRAPSGGRRRAPSGGRCRAPSGGRSSRLVVSYLVVRVGVVIAAWEDWEGMGWVVRQKEPTLTTARRIEIGLMSARTGVHEVPM